MKFNIIKYLFFILSVLFIFTSCSKSDALVPDATKKGDFSIEFDNLVGGNKLVLNNTTKPYKNASGESFTISRVQYYISNIQLTKADGSIYRVPQDPVDSSYFLIRADVAASKHANISVPEGDYTQVSFVLGVDSLRNTMGLEKRTGVLDPTVGDSEGAGMYWGWNSGYIFFKLEGNSSVLTTTEDPTGKQQFKYHIGGFGGMNTPTINNLKTVTLDLKTAGIAQVRSGYRSNIHLFVDLMKVFDGKTTVKIKEHPNLMFDPFTATIAQNYAGMFKHDHTENGEKSGSEE
ncbi:hypothetical protein LZQ00_17460 [Sphingobacterium sp. SRCM116780]|uniref:MbnP family protein n=1 Tax=Sphingobacterium sp. SRCM116780 TaxID=2907623 RepID=UPI001F17E494|nr:MbnP family protein [Sphingobacterium sp. SRCM116780]UIR56039.1 hypothetical protein LZQ00_17460 [Sphingobacterium sp. SRCM116780]